MSPQTHGAIVEQMEKSEGAERLTHHQIAIAGAVGDLSSVLDPAWRNQLKEYF